MKKHRSCDAGGSAERVPLSLSERISVLWPSLKEMVAYGITACKSDAQGRTRPSHDPHSYHRCGAILLLQTLYTESYTSLPEEDRCGLAHLLQSYSDVFSMGPNDLCRTNLKQHPDNPGAPIKQQPHRMAQEKQTLVDL
ncbi:hypothetical protein EXN66_Car003936 [Channa argus]|uniref:Uncharacterized protein n=1 Tax=Channa argus TaxID=215402 RepID=A0A6G1PDQ9_CHAAH|nr:hypothetical protein EXN66_Car003936 [Channa argus]